MHKLNERICIDHFYPRDASVLQIKDLFSRYSCGFDKETLSVKESIELIKLLRVSEHGYPTSIT